MKLLVKSFNDTQQEQNNSESFLNGSHSQTHSTCDVRCEIETKMKKLREEECFRVRITRVAKGDIALFTLVLENGVLLLQREFRFGCCYTVRGYTVRGTRWC